MPLRDVTCVVDVQMVAAVIGRKDARGLARVAHGRVEVDHAVELTARTNPSVHLPSHLLLLRRGKADGRRTKERTLEWRDGRPDGPNPFFVRACDELTIAGYDALCAHAFGRRDERAGEENVIDAERKDDIADACLSQHVTIKTREASLAKRRPQFLEDCFKRAAQLARTVEVAQQPIADDALCAPAF